MDRIEYAELKRRAEEDYQQNLAAIERVWAISQTNGAPVVPSSAPSVPTKRITTRRPRGTGTRGKILQDVRASIQNIPGIFNFSQVIERLAIEKPELEVKNGTLKAILKKLIEIGELELITQGIGRRPSQYKKK